MSDVVIGKRRREILDYGESIDISRFVDLEAEVANEEEEEEDDEELDDFVIEDEAEDEAALPLQFSVSYGATGSNEVEIQEAQMMARIANIRAKDHHDMSRSMGEEAHLDLDAEGVWSYWMVSVRKGRETSAVKLLNEFLPVTASLKVFNAPQMPCRVYVAGLKDIPVPDVVRLYAKHLAGIYTHRNIVRLSELDRRLLVQNIKDRAPHPTSRFPANSWVRIRSGAFEGDVARVYKSHETSDVVELMVVPRQKGVPKLCKLSTKKRRNVSSQALHVAEEVPGDDLLPGPIEGTYMVRDDIYFDNGLKYVKAQGAHYVRKCTPTAEDVWFFTLAGVDTLRETNSAFLRQQDPVVVRWGGNRDARGIVLRKHEESVDVKILGGSTEHLAMDDVERVFDVGTHIAVRLGHARGRNGIVLAADGGEIIFIDHDTNEQITIHRSAVEIDVSESRVRNIPTLAVLQSRSLLEPGKPHPAMFKTVYVIPLRRFGRICGVAKQGTRFFVEHKSKSDWAVFLASELLATDVWLTLENGRFEGTEDVKKLYSIYIERGVNPLIKKNRTDKVDDIRTKVRYIDTLSIVDHIVFVVHSNFKAFGQFLGTNGHEIALVLLPGKPRAESFKPHEVISMKTGRFLTGVYAGSIRTLRSLHAKRFGRTFSSSQLGLLPWRRYRDDDDQRLAINIASPQDPNVRASGPLPRYPCSFLDEPQFASIMKEYHIVFRFKTGCENPRSVDGKTAWTTSDSNLTSTGEIRVTFKTQEGGARVLDEFVPQASLLLCSPGIGKGEMAVVVDGLDSGKVVFPSRIARNKQKVRTGLYCKLELKGKKKDEILYTNEQITRVVSMLQGPPTH